MKRTTQKQEAIERMQLLQIYKNINITRADENDKEMILRANGKPQYSEKVINGIPQKVVTVGGKSYIPNY